VSRGGRPAPTSRVFAQASELIVGMTGAKFCEACELPMMKPGPGETEPGPILFVARVDGEEWGLYPVHQVCVPKLKAGPQ
jgi:hypothetical protein